MRRRANERGGGTVFAGALVAAGLLMMLFAASGRPKPVGPAGPTSKAPPETTTGQPGGPVADDSQLRPLPADQVAEPGAEIPAGETPGPDVELPLPAGAERPVEPELPREGIEGLVAPGQGYPTEFQTNRKAVLHVGDRQIQLPAVLWFDDRVAPDGDTPFTFRMKPGGAGYHDFRFSIPKGGPAAPCRFTDADGNVLEALDVKFSVEAFGEDRVRSLFKLQLVRP